MKNMESSKKIIDDYNKKLFAKLFPDKSTPIFGNSYNNPNDPIFNKSFNQIAHEKLNEILDEQEFNLELETIKNNLNIQ